MFIPRTLSSALKELAGQFPVVFLTGPRQSGKSTLLKHDFPDYSYVNLEDPDTRQMALEDPRGFLSRYTAPLIIDEAQRAPDLFSYLQGIVDDRRISGSYILSGSQNFLMMRSITQSLAGRVGIATLLPLSLPEMQQADRMPASANDWLFTGNYPENIAAGINTQLFYENYVKTYLERDISKESGLHDLVRFRSFMAACAQRAGGLINYSDLARDVSADLATVRSWFSILEESYLCFRLMPYYQNYGKRFTKTPKLYFYDTGLLCSLLRLSTPDMLTDSDMRGHIFENAVIAEHHKQRLHANRQPYAYYWRSIRGEAKEIDLLFDDPLGLKLYEVKAAKTANDKFAAAMVRYTKDNNLKNATATVIYDGINDLSLGGAHFVNWRDFQAPG